MSFESNSSDGCRFMFSHLQRIDNLRQTALLDSLDQSAQTKSQEIPFGANDCPFYESLSVFVNK